MQEISAAELERVCSHNTVIKSTNRDALVSLLSTDFDSSIMEVLDDGVCIDGDINLNAVLGKIINAGITITAVNTHRSSIEEYYLAMMGGNKNA
jgi:ABC-2 type transport system ATP-binding protein